MALASIYMERRPSSTRLHPPHQFGIRLADVVAEGVSPTAALVLG